MARQPTFVCRAISQYAGVRHHRDPSHESQLLKRLAEERKKGTLCDITLHAGGLDISAHKVVLIAASDYFKAMFETQMQEKEQDSIVIPELNGEILSVLIDYIYSNQVDITPDNVLELLMTASYLCMENVATGCWEYLRDNMSPDSCLGILQSCGRVSFAGSNKLHDSARIYALQHYMEVCQEKEFLELPLDLLADLLSDEKLCVVLDGAVLSSESQELAIFNSIVRYVNHDEQNRRKDIHKLMAPIRLSLLSETNIEMVRQVDVVKSSPECMSLISGAQALGDGQSRTTCMARQFAELRFTSRGPFANDMYVGPELETFEEERMHQAGQAFITGMKLWIRRRDEIPVLGGIQVFYTGGTSQGLHGTGEPEESYEFHMEPDERIVGAIVRSGWMIDALTFFTNKDRQFGPYGGPGGEAKFANPPEDVRYPYLAYISGCVVESQGTLGITRLKYQWAHYKFEEDSSLTVSDHLEDSDTDWTDSSWESLELMYQD